MNTTQMLDNNQITTTNESGTMSNIDIFLNKECKLNKCEPWNKLDKIHKKIKIKEFLDNNLFNASNKNLNFIKKLLLTEFENNKLNSAKKVSYDPMTSRILGISGLSYSTDTNEYSYKK